MNKILTRLLLLLLLYGGLAEAQTLTVEGINYRLNGEAAYVNRDQTTEATVINIPPTVSYNGKEYPVTYLDWGCFEGKVNLKEVSLPESITVLYGHSFSGCTSLRSVNLPAGITRIGANCFDSCTSLSSLTLPDSLLTIDSYAFSDCTSLTSITIPDKVTTISHCIFYNCTSLQEVIIGKSVETIGESMFSGASSLSAVWLKPTTPPVCDIRLSISSNAKIYVPKGSYSNYKAANIWKDYDLYTYGPETFNQTVVVDGLTYYYRPGNDSYFVTCQSEDPSLNYQELDKLILPSKITVEGTTFPVAGLMVNAFAGSVLSYVSLPATIARIGSGVFSNCKNLTSISLPESLTYIENGSFTGSVNIQNIYCEAQTPPTLANNAFPDDIYTKAALIVPEKYESAYRQASGWKNFKVISVSIDEVRIGDLMYKINALNHTASVIAENETGNNYVYTDNDFKRFVIPTVVTYNGEEYTVTEIASNAFKNSCFSKLTIPATIQTVGTDAFENSRINTIDVPSFEFWYTRFTLENRPFLTNEGFLYVAGEPVDTVVITAEPYVPSYAFRGCQWISTLEIGKGITNWNTAYEGMGNISTLIIGEDVKRISAIAVANVGTGYSNRLKDVICKSLHAPELPDRAFPNARDITLTVPVFADNSYRDNGWYSFTKRKYTDMTLPEYPDLIFGRGTGSYQVPEGSVAVSPVNNEIGGDIKIPASVNVEGNTFYITVASYFYNCPNIESLSIPYTLQQIYSFELPSLKKFIMSPLDPEKRVDPTVQFIELMNSFSLTRAYELFLENPEVTLYIGSEPLKDLVLPYDNNLEGIFRGCKQLESVTFHGNIYKVDDGAFKGCPNIKTIRIEYGYNDLTFGNDVFADSHITNLYLGKPFSGLSMQYLTNLTIGDKITEIPANLCPGAPLKSLFIPASVTSIGANAFKGCTGLSEINFAESISNLTIGESAFSNCSGLTDLNFPKNISNLAIGKSAFSNCSGLSEINFAEGISNLSIGVSAFSGCTSLTEVPFLKSLTAMSIGSLAFSGCSSIKSLSIPEYVTSIGSDAFSSCEALSQIVFEKSSEPLAVGANIFAYSPLTSVYYARPLSSYQSSNPFSGTSGKFDLTVAASVGPYLFKNSNLKSVTFDKGISSIGSYAFYNCKVLEKVVIPSDVETIDSSAFAECSNLSDLEIQDASRKLILGTDVFSNCNIENLYLGRTVEISSTNSLNYGVFASNPNLKSVELGRYVTSIDKYQFRDCPNLFSLTIGIGVRDIDKDAFYISNSPVPNEIAKVIWLPNTRPQGYENVHGLVNYVSQSSYDLENQKIYQNLSSKFWVNGVLYVFNRQAVDRTCVAIDCKYIPSGTYAHVPNEVTYMGIPFKIEEINEYTFYKNTYIAKVEIGNNITKVGDFAFLGCRNLESVFIPNSVKMLGEWAFAECESLNSAILGTGLSEIRTGCFSGDKMISEFMVPSGVTMIGNQVFDGCASLRRFEIMDRQNELYLGYSEKVIDNTENPIPGKPLFIDAPLEEVYIGGNISYSKLVEDGYSPFYRNDSLKKVTVADNETEISDYEFYGCRSLEEVFIGNGVESIGDYAFSGCLELNKFTFGNKVSEIGIDAFSDCGNMTSLTSYNPVPPTCGSQALDDINKFKCTLYVPQPSVDTYARAAQWENFFYIKPITAVAVPVTSLSLDYTTLTLMQGEPQQIATVILPEDASVPTLSWDSSDDNVAMVSQFGNVVAISPGSCYITASTTDGSNIKQTCYVSVTEYSGVYSIEVAEIRINRHGDTLTIIGAADDDSVTVVNLGGTVEYHGMEKTIERLAPGIHIVIVRNQVFKILI